MKLTSFSHPLIVCLILISLIHETHSARSSYSAFFKEDGIDCQDIFQFNHGAIKKIHTHQHAQVTELAEYTAEKATDKNDKSSIGEWSFSPRNSSGSTREPTEGNSSIENKEGPESGLGLIERIPGFRPVSFLVGVFLFCVYYYLNNIRLYKK